MYDLVKETVKALVAIFVLGFMLQIGWNAFVYSFCGFGEEMTYGSAIGFWILFVSIVMCMRVLFPNKEESKGQQHIHYHLPMEGDEESAEIEEKNA